MVKTNCIIFYPQPNPLKLKRNPKTMRPMPKGSQLEPEDAAERERARRQFGANLSSIMETLDTKPADLAELLGFHVDTIYKYMRGDRDPELWIIVRIARYLRVSTDALIVGKNRPQLKVIGRR